MENNFDKEGAFIGNTYSVYLHVFPNGKKYVGSTSLPLRDRWDGGLGYERQKRMFSAILKYGWENISHYLLFDGLDKKTALTIEAMLIREWKTYTHAKGYNTVLPQIASPDKFEIQKMVRTVVLDPYGRSVEDRRHTRDLSCSSQAYKCKPVRLVETGEVFKSATIAARHVGTSVNSISRAAQCGSASGTCWIKDEDEGWQMEVPAHWEYIKI